MTKTKKVIVKITEEGIVEKIHIIRGMKVMLDRDLAEMYDVENKSFETSREKESCSFS